MLPASATFQQLQAERERVAKQAALDACDIRPGMIVTRNTSPVKGRVVRRWAEAYRTPSCWAYRVKCTVAWEAAKNGAQRFGGGTWATTSSVLAERLRKAEP